MDATGHTTVGHDVTFVDISERRVQALREPSLNAGTTVDLPADRSAFIILTLPAPHVGHAYHLRAFTEAPPRSAARWPPPRRCTPVGSLPLQGGDRGSAGV